MMEAEAFYQTQSTNQPDETDDDGGEAEPAGK
jgi:hypothetical protein